MRLIKLSEYIYPETSGEYKTRPIWISSDRIVYIETCEEIGVRHYDKPHIKVTVSEIHLSLADTTVKVMESPETIERYITS